MKAMEIGQHSKPIRIVVGGCFSATLLTLAGCSFLDTVTVRTAPPDDRIPLGWQDGALYLNRGELEDYRCMDGLPLQCESVSGKSLCHCPRR